MKISSKEILQKLKLIEYRLNLIKNNNLTFKKLYEKTNNEKIDIEDIFITDGGRNIFSDIPKDVIEYLDEKGEFNKLIFNPKNKSMKIGCYYELLEVIHYLINILEFDLTKAAVIE